MEIGAGLGRTLVIGFEDGDGHPAPLPSLVITIKGKTYNFRRSLFFSPYNRGLFEAIAKKEEEHIIKKKADAILSLQRKLASPEVKGSLDADEDIGVDEVNSVRDGAFVIGEINVESMKVRSKFGEFSKNKKSVEEVVVGGGEA
ncbi:hypothetical protein Tco_0739275, partial [Tanacetum coccineum]